MIKAYMKDADTTAVVTADVTTVDLGDIGTADTFTLTPVRVDSGATGATTTAVTFSGAGTQGADMQTVIRALGGIYAGATVANTSAEVYTITIPGGYDVTWTVNPTGFTPGTTVETTAGKVTYTAYMPVRGTYAEVKRLKLAGFVDNSLDVTITDSSSTPLTIFSKTALDTFTTNADTPYIKLLTADGVAGEDGAAASNASSGVFTAPFKVVVATSSPITAASGTGSANLRRPYVGLVIENQFNAKGKRFLKRSTGAIATADPFSTTVNLGARYANIKRIKLSASADTSVAPTITDADGFVAYTKTSTSYTTPVDAQLVHEGVDQAANAVADLLDVVVKSPVTVSGTGLGSGTFTVEFIVKV